MEIHQNFRFPTRAIGSLIAFSAMAFASKKNIMIILNIEIQISRAAGSSSTAFFFPPAPSSSSSDDSSSSSEGSGVASILYW